MTHVIARLKGGLGNQMFQYATGYAVAHRLGVPLLVDTTILEQRGPEVTWTPRSLELDVFAPEIRIANKDEVSGFETGTVDRLLRKMTGRGGGLITEDPGIYTKLVLDCRAPVLLDGYWQSEEYFGPQANELRERVFVPRVEPSEKNAELLALVRCGNSASMHIRRGDYANNPATRHHHGLVPVEDNLDAARWLMRERGVDHFFIFSDEPDWAIDHLDLPAAMTFVTHNTGKAAHWDIFLMKNCRHHIIANSSFSWWGAWLNPDQEKTVIAPRQWFAGDTAASDRILPKSWMRMPLNHG